MSREISAQIIRWLVLVGLQVLIFKNISLVLGPTYYLNVIIYPLIILLLPMSYPDYLVLIIAFVTGLAVDVFYDSPGVHAASLVGMAFFRRLSLNLNEPKGGYTKDNPTIMSMGAGWFFRYATPLVCLHMLFYFSLEAFQLSLWAVVLLKSLIASVASMVFVTLYMFIFRPKV